MAPLLNEHDYRWNPNAFFLENQERLALVRRFLENHAPIVLIAQNSTRSGLEEICSQLSPSECSWRGVETLSGAYLAVMDPGGLRLWPAKGSP